MVLTYKQYPSHLFCLSHSPVILFVPGKTGVVASVPVAVILGAAVQAARQVAVATSSGEATVDGVAPHIRVVLQADTTSGA